MTERQFAGAAQDYARYRLPYPDRLIEDLVEAAGPGGELLDLACGTGELAIPLSPHFRRVRAVDAEPDMIDIGRRKAAGIATISCDAEMRRALRGFESEGGLTELVDFRCVLGRRS